jgi:squalene-hopene/tetraprenyl-beta-curcumene cyclase
MTLDRLRRELLDERTDDGHWVGKLSPSSLSTATAVSAMSAVVVSGHQPSRSDDQLLQCIKRGIGFLSDQQNADGGFGDTDRSHSNIATSYLALAASALGERAAGQALAPSQTDRLKRYIDATGSLDALRRRYGKDKTFVVPILTNLAIAELVSWNEVPALPFEAAVFPQSMYRLLRMPVVSYAIPALVAIGQARHYHGRPALWPLRWIRAAAISPAMRVLRQMQPESGGYLEATPLTSFVVMSLAVTGRRDHDVSRCGLRFLTRSMNHDGGWPIDTNLATWLTSLSIHALACDPEDDGSWCSESLVAWHLACQHRRRHPFTGAEPGGWGWSDLSGAVPDSDDTPAAILAIRQFQPRVGKSLKRRCDQAIEEGCSWLRRLQNRDGGWPTFCRGWGKLPFDRSSNDLTAHALRAMLSTPSRLGQRVSGQEADAKRYAKALAFLEANQREDGSWLPLWFGNQDRADESNPVYGTTRVLVASALGILDPVAECRGCDFLIADQNADGGWGGGPSISAWLKTRSGESCDLVSSVEETALAVDALTTVLLSRRNKGAEPGVESGQMDEKKKGQTPFVRSARRAGSRQRGSDPSFSDEPGEGPKTSTSGTGGGNDACRVAIIRGVEFLLGSVDEGRHRVPWPIGFYFAKLWYHEQLYPLIFTTTALGKYLRATAEKIDPDWPR